MHYSRVLVFSLLMGIGFAEADDVWPGFRGPNGDNSQSSGPLVRSFSSSGPKVLWSLDVSAGYGGSSIVDGTVFFMDRVDQEWDVVRCVGLDDGKELWKWKHQVGGRIPHPGSRVVPTVTEDAVYASSGFGHVYCIDRKTHKERWVVDVAKVFGVQPPRFGYSVHPLILGDHCIIAPTGDAVGIVALDKKTGKEVWRSQGIGGSHSSPILVKILNRDVIVMPGTQDGSLWVTGVDPKNGKQLFKYVEKLASGRFNPIPSLTMIDSRSAYMTGGYGMGSKRLGFAGEGESILVTKLGEIQAGSTLHPVLKVGTQYYLTTRGGGGGRAGGGRRRGGATGGARPPQGGRPGGGSGDSAGLVCLDASGKVLWQTGREPALSGGSLISTRGLIISQDGADGSLRLIEPGGSYKELAKGTVFREGPGSELWAPLALADGRLIMRSQSQIVCVDLRAPSSD